MLDVENYKRKKRGAWIGLLAFSLVLIGLLMMVKHGAASAAFLPIMMLWTNFLVKYETLSTRIDILEEFRNKEGVPKNDVPE